MLLAKLPTPNVAGRLVWIGVPVECTFTKGMRSTDGQQVRTGQRRRSSSLTSAHNGLHGKGVLRTGSAETSGDERSSGLCCKVSLKVAPTTEKTSE